MDSKDLQNLSPEQRVAEIAARVSDIITLLGEDVDRPGLQKTPVRAAKALWFLTSGYRANPSDTLTSALFDAEGSRFVTVRDIEFYSMCEHHILPFFGTVSICYIPGDKIVGLSKIARLVNIYARRLQVQERFTSQLCAEIMDTLGAKGVLVKCSAEHLCMKMRGVEKQHAATVTLDYAGLFATDSALRGEALASIN